MADAMKLVEVIETLEFLTKSPGADEFDRGARAARLDALDMLRPLSASPPAREEAPTYADELADESLRRRNAEFGREEPPGEGAGEQWLWRIPGRGWVLERSEPDVVREARVNGEWVKTEVIALSALRNRTSEPEAGAVVVKAICQHCQRATVVPPETLALAHPAPATADKLRDTSAKIGSELEFIKLIAANLKGDIDRMEEGFTKSQRSRGTERVMLEVRQRSDTLIQCAADALAALNEGGK